MDGEIVFHEEQQFRQPWLWAVMGISLLAGFLPVAWGMVRQLVFGIPWGNHPTSNAVLLAIGLSVFALNGALFALFWSARLTTEVRADSLYLRFFPFHWNWLRFGWDEILNSEAVTYNPIGEYGGWGIRYGGSGRAYNVSGNRGVRLQFANGKSLLVGSQRADELAAALHVAR